MLLAISILYITLTVMKQATYTFSACFCNYVKKLSTCTVPWLIRGKAAL